MKAIIPIVLLILFYIWIAYTFFGLAVTSGITIGRVYHDSRREVPHIDSGTH